MTFTATDNGTPVLSDSEAITITVTNTNRAPVLAAIGNKTVAENALLTFTVSATDADGDTLTYSATGLPTGATLQCGDADASAGRRRFAQAGSYPVTLHRHGQRHAGAVGQRDDHDHRHEHQPCAGAGRDWQQDVAENALLTFTCRRPMRTATR